MSRWSIEEQRCLEEMRSRLKDEIAAVDPLPDVIGDRRLLRFIRSKQLRMDEVVPIFSSFLKWRRENDVDRIRHDILYGGKNTPFLFPFGKAIIDLAPQIIITPLARDFKGQPLALEQYCFSPKDVLKTITIDQYLVFLTYALEYRSLVLEQMSHEMEKEYLDKHGVDDRKDGYGLILLDFTIRDMKGISLAHLGADGRALVRAALNVGLVNYPECLGKCHFINVPWIFNSMWYFVKGMLDEQTLEKISLSGSDNLNVLLQDMTLDNIPTSLGGRFASYNEPFEFDLSPDGPFYYDGVDIDLKSKYPLIWSTYHSKSNLDSDAVGQTVSTTKNACNSVVHSKGSDQNTSLYLQPQTIKAISVADDSLRSFLWTKFEYEIYVIAMLVSVAVCCDKNVAVNWLAIWSILVVAIAFTYHHLAARY